MKDEHKLENFFINVLFLAWVGCWYLSIWIAKFWLQLFLTGLFNLALAILFNETRNDRDKK